MGMEEEEYEDWGEEYEWEEYWEDRDAYDELMEGDEDGYDDCD
jgi:hypothetical protein